jgi:hypothetical protein
MEPHLLKAAQTANLNNYILLFYFLLRKFYTNLQNNLFLCGPILS